MEGGLHGGARVSFHLSGEMLYFQRVRGGAGEGRERKERKREGQEEYLQVQSKKTQLFVDFAVDEGKA